MVAQHCAITACKASAVKIDYSICILPLYLLLIKAKFKRYVNIYIYIKNEKER